jgi:uncharacterized SAM-binding protein YcdF (DUF218 family)
VSLKPLNSCFGMIRLAGVKSVDCEATKDGIANRPARSVPERRGIVRRLRQAAVVVLIVLGMGALVFGFRAAILTELAELYVVNDTGQRADVIVILGGGLENRPIAAAKLYREGRAPKLLYMGVRLTQGAKMGIIPSEQEMTRRMLLSNNVPESAMEAVGHEVANTHDEAVAVRAWAEKNKPKSILIATDLFHTRRARWIFEHELRGTGVEVSVSPVRHVEGFGTHDWWKTEAGLIVFETEVLKLVYYHFKY